MNVQGAGVFPELLKILVRGGRHERWCEQQGLEQALCEFGNLRIGSALCRCHWQNRDRWYMVALKWSPQWPKATVSNKQRNVGNSW
jgi:hypothetical protein